jgi:uncharacterized membrane protein
MIRRTDNLLWRACRVVGGIVVLLAGLFLSLPGIPGPGIVVIVLGLGILSSEFDWAERLYTRLKKIGQTLLQRKNSPKAPSSMEESQKGG